MPKFPTDTHPEVAELQIRLLREAGPSRRFALASSITGTVMHLAMQALERTRPEMSEWERKLLFAELNYGAELACAVRSAMEEKRQ
jgi:hypothetical protein